MKNDLHFAEFRSDEPCTHVPRALDMIRRMGFELRSLSVSDLAPPLFNIRIAFRPVGQLSADTFLERLKQTPGVEDLVSPPSA